MTPLEKVLSLLPDAKQHGDQFQATCPAHEDKKASLSIREGANGKAILKCFAGCETLAILSALGITWDDLFPPKDKPERARIIATYDYVDENGVLLYQAVRYDPKSFKQRRPDGDGWLWNLQGVRRVLYRLPDVVEAAKSGQRVYLVEGEKDANNLRKAGIPCATTNAGGAAKWDDSLASALIGAEVIIIPDNDGPGRDHAVQVAQSLRGKTPVKILKLEGLQPKGDVTDWLKRYQNDLGAACMALEHGADKCPLYTGDDLPAIEVNRKQLRVKTQEAMAALKEKNSPPFVFARSGKLVRVAVDEHLRPTIESLNTMSLRGILARCANFYSTSDDRGQVPVAPPKDMVEDFISLPHWEGIPPLTGIVTAPVVAPDGSLVSTPGYLPQAQVYYHERNGLTLGDTTPTAKNLKVANDLFSVLLGDFPFVDQASKAHAMALLFLPFVRPMIHGPTPFHLVSAPTPGSGKSLLVKACTSAFVPGGAAEQPAPGHDDEEWRKRITTALMSGGSHVWLDNISRKLDSGQFALVLTANEWRDRMLGGNSEITVPVRAVFVGTGNNITLSDEITRRTIEIRLDSEEERPWDRDSSRFKIGNLSEWVRTERGPLLTASLTLLQKWIADGRPLWKGKTLGSFESWSRIIGGILGSNNVDGFLANREDLYERLDPEREKWCFFFKRWHEKHGGKPVGTADIVPIALECDIMTEDNRGNRNVLGRQIRQQCDRVYMGLRLIKAKDKDRLAQYQVVTKDVSTVSNVSIGTKSPIPYIVSDVCTQETPIRTEGFVTVDTFDTVTPSQSEKIDTSLIQPEIDKNDFEDPFGGDEYGYIDAMEEE